MKSLRSIDGASVLLSRTVSTQNEIVVEAYSLSIPKTVGGPSIRFHERINIRGHDPQTGR